MKVMNRVWKWWSSKELQRRVPEQVQAQSNETLSLGLSIEQQLITEQLMELPWETLSPQLDTPKEMLSLARFYSLSSTNARLLPFFKFIAHIITRIDWNAFKPHHTFPQSPPTFSGYTSLVSPSPTGNLCSFLIVDGRSSIYNTHTHTYMTFFAFLSLSFFSHICCVLS
jgi:hypothetical protein